MCFFPKKFFWHCIYYILYIHNISFIIEPFCSDLNFFFFLDWFNIYFIYMIMNAQSVTALACDPWVISSNLALSLPFLAHLNWQFNWAFLITCRPSSVCPSVRPQKVPALSQGEIITKLQKYINKIKKNSPPPEPFGQFQPILAQCILG